MFYPMVGIAEHVSQKRSTPAYFRTWLVGDRERWERVIKAAGVKAE